MFDSIPVRLHDDSAPSLLAARAKIRRTRPDRHAADLWKRLFLLALARMARRQPALARRTAIDTLNVLGTLGPVLKFRRSGWARGYLKPLRAMERQRLSAADLRPRSGLHPWVLERRYAQAVQLFVKEKRGTREEIDKLLKSWDRRPLTDAGWRALCDTKTDRQLARLFMARVARVKPASLKTMLSRKGNRTRE